MKQVKMLITAIVASVVLILSMLVGIAPVRPLSAIADSAPVPILLGEDTAGFGGGSPTVTPTYIYVPDHYPTIQAAIDASNPGDTVIVRDGTYNENVLIDKDHLTVTSENGAEHTVLQAAQLDEDIVRIEGRYGSLAAATIEGFTIRGAMDTFHSAVAVGNYADGSRIENNIIDMSGSGGTCWGIDVTFAENVTISGNIINGDEAIDLTFADNAIVTGNTVVDGWISIGSSSSVTVSGNTLNRCEVWPLGSTNSFSGNVVSGGFVWVTSTDCSILDNTFIGGRGLLLSGESSHVGNNIFEACGLSVSSSNNAVENCTVNGKPLMYLEGAVGLTVDSADVGQIILVQCQGMTVRDCSLSNTSQGIQLYETSGCLIENNIVQDCGSGISLERSSNNSLRLNYCDSNYNGIVLYTYSDDNVVENNIVSGNTIGIPVGTSSRNRVQSNCVAGGSTGIYLTNSVIHVHNGQEFPIPSEDNLILDNDVRDNSYGISAYCSKANQIYHNNFSNSIRNAYDQGEGNLWDNGAVDGGNHWSDHTCTGNPSDGSQPYNILGDAASVDHYPFQDEDGWVLGIFVAVNSPNGGENWEMGTVHEITWTASGGTSVDIYYSIDSGVTWTPVAVGEANDGAYSWATPNAPSTTCRVKVVAHDASGGIGEDISDDDFYVYPRWDIDRDGMVDYKDLAILGATYGCCDGDPGYNPDADIDQDGCVDYKDLAILGAHYGEVY